MPTYTPESPAPKPTFNGPFAPGKAANIVGAYASISCYQFELCPNEFTPISLVWPVRDDKGGETNIQIAVNEDMFGVECVNKVEEGCVEGPMAMARMDRSKLNSALLHENEDSEAPVCALKCKVTLRPSKGKVNKAFMVSRDDEGNIIPDSVEELDDYGRLMPDHPNTVLLEGVEIAPLIRYTGAYKSGTTASNSFAVTQFTIDRDSVENSSGKMVVGGMDIAAMARANANKKRPAEDPVEGQSETKTTKTAEPVADAPKCFDEDGNVIATMGADPAQ